MLLDMLMLFEYLLTSDNPKSTGSKDLFPWITLISLQGKTNFFQKQGESEQSGQDA